MRQNTPHPKELKAKAHKLFAKGSKQGSLEDSEIEKSQSTSVKSPELDISTDHSTSSNPTTSKDDDDDTLKEVCTQ